MVKILLWCVFIYFIYKLVFDLVIPVSRTASQFKRKVAEMQQQQQAFQNQQTYQTSTAHTQSPKASPTTPKKDDYIEFEEVK